MKTFTLASGRQIEKDASFCVAVKCNGRWNHQWFKSRHGADNEIRRLRGYSADTVAYYGIESYRLIKPEEISS
jgi:hypothetical protein